VATGNVAANQAGTNQNAQNCPPGTRFVRKQKRCVATGNLANNQTGNNARNCPPGTRYVRRQNRCVAAGNLAGNQTGKNAQNCPRGTRFVRQQNRCVRIANLANNKPPKNKFIDIVRNPQRNCGRDAYWNRARGACYRYVRTGVCPRAYRWSTAWRTCLPVARAAYCGTRGRWDWLGRRCIAYTPFNLCRPGSRLNWRSRRCVAWNAYRDYRDETSIGIGIVAGIADAAPQMGIGTDDFSDPEYGYFEPPYGDDTRQLMENAAIRALIDYTNELNQPIDEASVKILDSDTRGSFDILYVSGSATLMSGDVVYWTVRASDDENTRVLSVASDQAGELAAR
jgi:hypothetical protein